MAPQVQPKCFWHAQQIINNRQLKKKTGIPHQVWSHGGSAFKKMTLNRHFFRPAQTNPYGAQCGSQTLELPSGDGTSLATLEIIDLNSINSFVVDNVLWFFSWYSLQNQRGTESVLQMKKGKKVGSSGMFQSFHLCQSDGWVCQRVRGNHVRPDDLDGWVG